METYKIFKKSNNFLTFLTPLNENNKHLCAKLVTDNDIFIGYNDEEEMFIEIAQCPRIYPGMKFSCKNINSKKYEDLGELVDLQWNENQGYLFIFKKDELKEPDNA